MDSVKKIADAIIAARAQELYGLKPYDPAVNTPRDIGLGGPSTEYTATANDQTGQAMNYPQVWWDNSGNPQYLPGDAGYDQAAMYEDTTGMRFPRFGSLAAGDFAAMNRSAMGGAQQGPLASLYGFRR